MCLARWTLFSLFVRIALSFLVEIISCKFHLTGAIFLFLYFKQGELSLAPGQVCISSSLILHPCLPPRQQLPPPGSFENTELNKDGQGGQSPWAESRVTGKTASFRSIGSVAIILNQWLQHIDGSTLWASSGVQGSPSLQWVHLIHALQQWGESSSTEDWTHYETVLTNDISVARSSLQFISLQSLSPSHLAR